MYNVIGNAGPLLPGGSCPTVGIAGLALGGGIGVFGRKYGLTTDNIRSLTIVTATVEPSPPIRARTAICCGPVKAAAAETSVSSRHSTSPCIPYPR